LLQPPVLLRLVALLQQPQQGSIAEAAANMLARCCTSPSQVCTFASFTGVKILQPALHV
jgi:hypothetical protein